jgi:phosphomevalonate kinase
MATTTPTVGSETVKLLRVITALMLDTQDLQEFENLEKKHRALTAKLRVLIDNAIDESLPQYDAALDALKEATRKAAEAKADLSKLSDALNKITKAISGLTKLAATFA